ncbi:MAG: hypothetical protein ACLPVY_26590 [Acidimicrobiia bacterium]
MRDALEAVHFAEEVGLDCFEFGEHPTRSTPLSSPTALVNDGSRVDSRHHPEHVGDSALP